MQKLYIVVLLSLTILSAVLLTGCSDSESGASSSLSSSLSSAVSSSAAVSSSVSSEASVAGDAENQNEETSAVQDNSVSAAAAAEETFTFAPGTWESDKGQYYFFDADGASGRTANMEDGTGAPFSYTVDGAQVTFSWGADSSSVCTVSANGTFLVLEWEDGTTEQLIFAADEGSDSFQFYTNQELADLALAYYKAQNSDQDTSGLSAAAQTNDDGSVAIQIYENLGDHNSTADWYTVNRITATGTDSSGTEISLVS